MFCLVRGDQIEKLESNYSNYSIRNTKMEFIPLDKATQFMPYTFYQFLNLFPSLG